MIADALQNNPFQFSDPRFDYWSAAHRLAYEQFDFVLQSGLLFSAFLGETGVGKTTVARQAVTLAQSRRLIGVTAPGERLDGVTARTVMAAFGADPGPGDEAGHAALLRRSLAAALSQHGPGTLVIEDAHLLRQGTLSRLLALAGITGEDEPVFRLVLIGRPELQARLDAELPGLMGPVVELLPMSPEDTAGYIRHRLSVGGINAIGFDAGAVEAVHEATGGNPLRINLLCMFCLDEAWDRDQGVIDAALVRDCDVAPEAAFGPGDFAVRGLSMAASA
jgi:type II secretory pathway predicted ATPase ExeA